VLFGWHNVPTALLVSYLVITILNGLRHGLRVGRISVMIEGLILGFRMIWPERFHRSPVSRSVFRLYRLLVSRCAMPYSEVELCLRKR
jgi:hypothetical protein